MFGLDQRMAVVIGIGALLIVLVATGAALVVSRTGAVAPACTWTTPPSTSLSPSTPTVPPIAVCYQPPVTPPIADLIKSTVPTIISIIVGFTIFLLGQTYVASKERLSGQAAVTVVRDELDANRSAMETVIHPTELPGTAAPPARLEMSAFPELRVQLAQQLPYEILNRAFVLYAHLREIGSEDLHKVDAKELQRLHGDVADLWRDLVPYGRQTAGQSLLRQPWRSVRGRSSK